MFDDALIFIALCTCLYGGSQSDHKCINLCAYPSICLSQVAVVKSAVKLEQEQQFLIAKKLQELTDSKNIKLKPVIDESLIAGFIVEYGSAQIDMSVRGQLEMIANELEGKNVGMLAS